ncbi:PREDICTED: apolipoprotein F [Cyprinodon variegatus]|uniref:Apolipoprotein F n=1 Tax=Cyprinodon variegatus TaxID=28743 RepID=A0A3Q2C707_CYPVA|nr:PREDICTED: apolipoprotein F [Cyprinodon variegatus]
MFSKWKWLILIQLLLTDQTLCRVPSTVPKTKNLLQETSPGGDAEEIKENYAPLASSPLPALSLTDKLEPKLTLSQDAEKVLSAQLMTSALSAKLQDHIQDRLHIHGNISCEELLSASAMDDPLSSVFPQELMGLSLVPVLVISGCSQEAQTLVMKLYDLLGKADTEELLMELVALIDEKMNRSKFRPVPTSTALPSDREETNQHIDGLMFNVKQLALEGDGAVISQEGHCEGWKRLNGTMLLGSTVRGAAGRLEDAIKSCEKLGALCAGVTSGGPLMPGFYQAVLKKGSRIFPSASLEGECWIRQCSSQEELLITRSFSQRIKRSPQRSCINKEEEKVYSVVEWIPVVSTFYNLGTAVYYASVNCSATAKERAILSAVDLGTDALMVATGGTVGVAGYALGAGVKTGVKTGVKYLLNSMKAEDDMLVNQSSSERATFTVE